MAPRLTKRALTRCLAQLQQLAKTQPAFVQAIADVVGLVASRARRRGPRR